MTKLVVSKYDLFTYRYCEEAEVSNCVERWKKELSENIALYSENTKLYPSNSKYWNYQVGKISKILEQGFFVLSSDEFQAKVREHFLSKPIREITSENFFKALNALPPVNWVMYDDFEMFHISEADYSVYHTQYYRDKKTNKCFTCVSDVYDKSTWIDKRI